MLSGSNISRLRVFFKNRNSRKRSRPRLSGLIKTASFNLFQEVKFQQNDQLRTMIIIVIKLKIKVLSRFKDLQNKIKFKKSESADQLNAEMLSWQTAATCLFISSPFKLN